MPNEGWNDENCVNIAHIGHFVEDSSIRDSPEGTCGGTIYIVSIARGTGMLET